MTTESIGSFLKRQRDLKGMSIAEVSRVTRIPVPTLEAIESARVNRMRRSTNAMATPKRRPPSRAAWTGLVVGSGVTTTIRRPAV